MAKARPVPGLSEHVPFADAAAMVVSVRAQEVVEHSAGVLDLGDIERVHAMRVATRRLRAALEVFGACFDRKRFKRALREVKALADALGEPRDRDVAIAALTEFSDGIGEADRPGVDSLIATLREEQAEANTALEPWVAPPRLEAFSRQLRELVETAR